MTAERSHQLGQELGTLEGAGLIALAASMPELEYVFHHALIQDAAYATLLRPERRSLHLEVAEALLELYPDRRTELAPVLAHHFEQGDDQARAIEYLLLAARGAHGRAARHEAVDFARRALALLPDGDDVDGAQRRLRAELLELWAEDGLDFQPLTDTLALLERAIADSDASGDTALSTRAWLLVARARSLAGEQHRSSPQLTVALERARELAEGSGSPELVARALLAAGNAYYASSDFTHTVELLERAVPALVDSGQLYEASVAAGQLGMALGHVGDFERAVAWTDRASELGIESGDPNATLDADLGRSIVESIRGDTAVAVDYATRAAEVAERVDNKACAMVAHSVIGEQHLRAGDTTQATIAFEASADLATFCQFMPVKVEQTELLLQTARARAGSGRLEPGRYDKALELAQQFGDRLAEAQLYEQRARDRLAAGQPEPAEADLARAAELFEALGAGAHLQRVQELRADLGS